MAQRLRRAFNRDTSRSGRLALQRGGAASHVRIFPTRRRRQPLVREATSRRTNTRLSQRYSACLCERARVAFFDREQKDWYSYLGGSGRRELREILRLSGFRLRQAFDDQVDRAQEKRVRDRLEALEVMPYNPLADIQTRRERVHAANSRRSCCEYFASHLLSGHVPSPSSQYAPRRRRQGDNPSGSKK